MGLEGGQLGNSGEGPLAHRGILAANDGRMTAIIDLFSLKESLRGVLCHCSGLVNDI